MYPYLAIDGTLRNMRWRIRNGQSVLFYKHDWLRLGYPLYHKPLIQIDADQMEASTHDFVVDNSDWN